MFHFRITPLILHNCNKPSLSFSLKTLSEVTGLRIRVGLGSGSGRDFQIISDFFWADMQHVNIKYFLPFFLNIFAVFFV